MKQNYKNQSGYTIIETMIATSLFIIVVMLGMGALMNANLLHQKSESMRSIMDSLSFVMEEMSRNIRTGYNYRCMNAFTDLAASNINIPQSGVDCWGIIFESASGTTDTNDQWVYYIRLTEGGGTNLGIFKSVDGGVTSVQLTPNEVSIDLAASGFSILGAEPPSAGDTQQPFVTMRLVGEINLTGKNVETPFSLQTSVSHRLIDL